MSESRVKVKLGNLLTQAADMALIENDVLYRQVTVRMHNRGLVLRQECFGKEIKTKKQYLVRAGQLIYSRIDARNGAMGLVPSKLDGAIVSNDFPVFDINCHKIDPSFLNYYISTEAFTSDCLAKSKGTSNRRRLKEEDFLEIQVPLPSLEDQRRIVERIEGLAVRIDEIHKLQLDAGKETENLITSSLNKIFSLEEMSCWAERSLGDLADIVSGVTLGRSIEATRIVVPYLRVANVQDGWLDLAEIKEVQIRPHELEKWRLLPGDLLLTEGGDFDKLGRGTVWRGEVPDCIHQNHLFRVRLDQNRVLPDFVELEVRSSYGKDYFLSKAKKTTNLASINQTQLRAFPVRFPSIEKQYEIIHRANQFKALTGRLIEYQEKSLVSLNALIPSYLDLAFEEALT